jgi:hypothetical protein
MCGPDSTATIDYGPGSVAGETDAQRGIRENLVAMSREEMAKLKAPDLADAALRNRARTGLLKNRLASSGRAGAFDLPNPADIAKSARQRLVGSQQYAEDVFSGKL